MQVCVLMRQVEGVRDKEKCHLKNITQLQC